MLCFSRIWDKYEAPREFCRHASLPFKVTSSHFSFTMMDLHGPCCTRIDDFVWLPILGNVKRCNPDCTAFQCSLRRIQSSPSHTGPHTYTHKLSLYTAHTGSLYSCSCRIVDDINREKQRNKIRETGRSLGDVNQCFRVTVGEINEKEKIKGWLNVCLRVCVYIYILRK